MKTPFGDFIRSKRDATQPEWVGLPAYDRRRAPGLRRSELASLAGISVEYLTRIEQGHDRNPSATIVNALSDALVLDSAEREHLRYLAKITGGACAGRPRPTPPPREVRPTVLETLRLLEPGVAMVTNRLGDILAHTSSFDSVMRGTGLLDDPRPNLTRFVFTDPRSRTLFRDWDHIADEQVFDLWLGPSIEHSEWFKADLAPEAGKEFTRRLENQVRPPDIPLQLRHPSGHRLAWRRETLELSKTDAQQIVVFLPADAATVHAVTTLLGRPTSALRAVN